MPITLPTLRDLVDAGAHYGHQRAKSYPKARQFAFTVREHTLVINLEQTVEALAGATKALIELAANGKTILFVGTKPQAVEAVRAAATKTGMPYVAQRWLGGTLTNFHTIQQNLKKLTDLETLMASEAFEAMSKKDRGRATKQHAKLVKIFEGMKGLGRRPDALVLVDITEENIALAEARRLGVPTFAIVDTNANPDLVTHAIPANDDSRRAIALILDVLAEAILEGKSQIPAVVKPDLTDATKAERMAAETPAEAELVAPDAAPVVADAPVEAAKKPAAKKTTKAAAAEKKSAAKKAAPKKKAA